MKEKESVDPDLRNILTNPVTFDIAACRWDLD